MITYDTTYMNFTGGPTDSHSHTTAAGSNRIGLLCSYGNRSITSATWDSVAMTQAVGGSVDSNRGTIWYIVNPPVGTKTVGYALSSAGSVGLFSSTFAGVSQTVPIGATLADGVGPSSSSISDTISLLYPNSYTLQLEGIQASLTFTQDNSQTEIDDRQLAGTISIGGAYKSFATSGNQTLGFSTSSTSWLMNLIVELVDVNSIGVGNFFSLFNRFPSLRS